MYIFSIILFDTRGETFADNTQIAAHKEHFMELLRQHLVFQAKGVHELAAKRFGTVTEFISGIIE